jgi:hypothetical protein
MLPKLSGYKAYILRIWQAERDGQMVSFASLEDSRTGQRSVFTGLPALLAFLEQAGLPEPREAESRQTDP